MHYIYVNIHTHLRANRSGSICCLLIFWRMTDTLGKADTTAFAEDVLDDYAVNIANYCNISILHTCTWGNLCIQYSIFVYCLIMATLFYNCGLYEANHGCNYPTLVSQEALVWNIYRYWLLSPKLGSEIIFRNHILIYHLLANFGHTSLASWSKWCACHCLSTLIHLIGFSNMGKSLVEGQLQF